jgi:hypothetical protein
MHHRKHISCDHYPLLCDITTDTENIASSIVVCWTVFTELCHGNALIKSVTIHLFKNYAYFKSAVYLMFPLC